MPNSSAELSAPAERAAQHFRNYQFGGYRRADGLFDIEGRMTDAKTTPFPTNGARPSMRASRSTTCASA